MSKMSRTIAVVSALAILVVVVGSYVMKKEDEARAEARVRCVDPAVRKGGTLEVCVAEMMWFYHMNKRLPQLEVAVSAEESSPVRQTTLTELVKGNIFLFTPGEGQELSDDDLLQYELRNLGERFRITDLEIKENSRDAGHGLVVPGIEYAYIIVTPK